MVNYDRQTMALYSETFAARAIAIRNEFARQGFRNSELDSFSRETTNSIGIRIVGERIGALAQDLRE
jgi:hypothetical protein